MMPLVPVWPTPKGSPMASTRSPTWLSEFSPMVSTGSFSPAGRSIFRMARSVRASASMTLAGNSRRSDSATVISVPPSTTWLLVTMTPSDRTITPEPNEPSMRLRGAPRPKACQKGSTCWRTIRLDEMFTTAGATRLTTGAKDCFMPSALVGATRVAGCAKAGGPAAAMRAMRVGIRTRWARMVAPGIERASRCRFFGHNDGALFAGTATLFRRDGGLGRRMPHTHREQEGADQQARGNEDRQARRMQYGVVAHCPGEGQAEDHRAGHRGDPLQALVGALELALLLRPHPAGHQALQA